MNIHKLTRQNKKEIEFEGTSFWILHKSPKRHENSESKEDCLLSRKQDPKFLGQKVTVLAQDSYQQARVSPIFSLT